MSPPGRPQGEGVAASPSATACPVGAAPAAVPKADVALMWFRRDLRVADNPALVAALQSAHTVVPVYIWAPEEEGQFQPGRCSRWWLHKSLEALEADLAALGSRMIYRRGPESRTALLQLVQETGASALFFNHLYDPISLVRDNEVKAAMASAAIVYQSFNADLLYQPWEVLMDSGQPFTNFEGFWAKATNMPYPPHIPVGVPPGLPPVPERFVGMSLADIGLLTPEEELSNQQLDFSWSPGGRGAFQALEKFVVARLPDFDHDRAKTDRNSTSRLSPHIHYGEINVRHIYYVVKQREVEYLQSGNARGVKSCRDYLKQMGFREYARYLSFHLPFTHERSLLEHLRAVPWRFDQHRFKAWRQGRTGYPLVDAAMRELWSTGWMHNRMRVVCATFLVKNLLLPWQWGLKHYWDALLDADLECDALGWQYCTGCLADAHPFGYMINLRAESAKFDPSGNYVRRWLPVLSRLPNKFIHWPLAAPTAVLDDAGIEMGINYPFPVISQEESEEQVAFACGVIEQSLSGGDTTGEACAPFRPPTVITHLGSSAARNRGTPTTSVHAPHRENGQAGNNQAQSRGPQLVAAGQEEEEDGGQAPMEDSDEEVVSNSIGVSEAASGGATVFTGHISRAGPRTARNRWPANDTETVSNGPSLAAPAATDGTAAVVPSLSAAQRSSKVPSLAQPDAAAAAAAPLQMLATARSQATSTPGHGASNGAPPGHSSGDHTMSNEGPRAWPASRTWQPKRQRS